MGLTGNPNTWIYSCTAICIKSNLFLLLSYKPKFENIEKNYRTKKYAPLKYSDIFFFNIYHTRATKKKNLASITAWRREDNADVLFQNCRGIASLEPAKQNADG